MEKSSPEKLILVTREPGGVACITINRPNSLNSLTKSMMTDLARIFKSLNADDSVRVIILTGSGRSFCSGIDLTAAEDVFKGDFRDMEIDPVFQMERCRKPIIGAVAGFAVTGGFEISLACDILVASKDAKFLDTHARTYKNSAITTVKKGGPSATTKPIMQESDRMLNYELTCLITSPSVSTAPDACLCQPLTPPHWGIHISHLNMPKLSQPCSPHLVHHGDDSYLVRESSFLIFITPSKPTHHLNILISQLSSSKHVTPDRFGIFPSWGLSQKLSRIIGPNRAREVSLTATPINAEQAERWGLVNYVVDRSELLNKARQIAEAIIKNNQDLVLRYKAVINDGFKHDLTRALALEKVGKTVGIGGVIRNHTGNWVTSFSNKSTAHNHTIAEIEAFHTGLILANSLKVGPLEIETDSSDILDHVKPPYDSIISECRVTVKEVVESSVDHIDDASTQDPCLNDDLQISDLCPSVDSPAHVIQEMPLVNVGPRKTHKSCKPLVWLKDFVVPKKSNPHSNTNHVCYDNVSPGYKSYLHAFSATIEPQSFQEASQDKLWMDAMQQEILALEDNDTWAIVDIPPGEKAIGSKWVYKIKYKSNGEVERYKVRLVAKGYTQKEDLNYHDTFSPVAKMVTIRTIPQSSSFTWLGPFPNGCQQCLLTRHQDNGTSSLLKHYYQQVTLKVSMTTPCSLKRKEMA
ncbi:hypothetical protein KY285_001245 [Solanum tuberosum]|nr:hypothetical protein KY285_001245 [Solanum tuberosum]